ncbi:hypothetical protein O9K51_01861 [Purpureocillium lavendulum]|uniref:Uncharacterized protein n=1 Tax=Purpureocillium lavendulum TaxID=1247861 RepID=A0AB34G9C9_9HYPO|nr:hypothetical protein O9K51_01861 [Purpureocillium lavendulum]
MLLFLDAGTAGMTTSLTRLSAQYPSGNQTYSNPSRGGRGGSTPNEGGAKQRDGIEEATEDFVPPVVAM